MGVLVRTDFELVGDPGALMEEALAPLSEKRNFFAEETSDSFLGDSCSVSSSSSMANLSFFGVPCTELEFAR